MAQQAQRRRDDRKPSVRAVASSEGIPLPHDLLCEQSVLGAIITGGPRGKEALQLVLDMLKPEHLFLEPHQTIYVACGQLSREGKPVDIESVVGKLKDTNKIHIANGQVYIAEVLDSCSVIALDHVRARVERLIDLARHRSMIATCQRIAAEGYGTDAINDPLWCERSSVRVHDVLLTGTRSRATPMNVAMQEAVDKAVSMASSAGSVYGYASGIDALDQQTGGCLAPGELTVIKGKSGEGKSSFARQAMLSIAEHPEPDPEKPGRHIWNAVLLSSLEMTRAEVAMYSACSLARVDARKLRSKHRTEYGWESDMSQKDWLDFHSAAKRIGALPIFIEGDRLRTHAQLRAEIRQKQAELARGIVCPICDDGERCKARVAALFVDTLQLLTDNEAKRDDDEEKAGKIDRITRDLGTTAVDFKIAVAALSQENAGGGAYGSPGAIRAHAQTVLAVRYCKTKAVQGRSANDTTAPHEATIVIEKCRAGWEGKVNIFYVPAYTWFEE